MTDTPSKPSSPFMAAAPTSVLLKHPASRAGLWTLTVVYLAGLFFATPLLAALAAVTMPLGVGPDHARRALHLWAMGLLAAGCFVVKARAVVQGWGGLSAALAAEPAATWALVAGTIVAVVIGVWHLTWVASPRWDEPTAG